MSTISFDLKEFEDWLERQGCSCCTYGWQHIVDGNIRYDWESNINGVITKHKDIELYGKIEGEIK